MADIWWNLNLASPAEAYWRRNGVPARGEYGGRCNHPTCRHTGADWYNKASGRYYCDACARATNEICLAKGLSKLCELHL
jgi:hypothetical protein